MRKTILLLLLFILDFAVGFSRSQPMKTEIEKIKSQGKEAIIKMAFAILEERLPSLEVLPEDYKITVWANRKEVLVKFRRLIRYQQKDTHYRYDLSVEIISKRIEPFDVWGSQTNFFVPNQAQKKTIAYLTKRMDLPVPDQVNEVSEDEKNYYVTFSSKGGHSIYTINKETGEALEPLHVTYMVFPSDSLQPDSLFPESKEAETDPLVEIKD